MSLEALAPGNIAVVTGGASGIGRAAALAFAKKGMVVVVADIREELFEEVDRDLRDAGAFDVLTRKVDVSVRNDLERLEAEVTRKFGRTDALMCNAGIQPGSDILDSSSTWDKVLATNLLGVVYGCQIFAPGMAERGKPALIINTGSKQGITTPPGDPAYNTAKAGVKAFTEALAHEMRESGHAVSVHLLIPGFVFTDINRRGRTEKPAGAWTPEQTIEFMLSSLDGGDFYILCPDNDVPRQLDERRMAWASGDIIENRPALSRWHPDYADAFEAFVKGS